MLPYYPANSSKYRNIYYKINKGKFTNSRLKQQHVRKQAYEKYRLEALKIIDSQLSCKRCGCKDTRFLEINHKNSRNGEKRNKNETGNRFFHRIINGSRQVNDLELLCRPCNHIHFLEMKFGFTGLKVIWEKLPS